MAKKIRGDYKKRENQDEAVQKILNALKNGLHRDSACAVSNVPRRTFYERLKDDNFRTKVVDSEEYWLAIVENKKRELIMDKYRPAIEKELKSKRAQVYGDKSEVSQTIQHDFVTFAGKSLADLEKLRKDLLGNA